MLKIRNLYKSFGKVEVLKGVDLDVVEGEILVIVGPSGGGKTTLLRSINCLERCEAGSIVINGKELFKDGHYASKKELTAIRKDIGLVFQGFNLFPHRTVLENIIEAPTRVLGKTKKEATESALEILGFLGLTDKANNYPFELSGGQKQRAAIGRALAMDPKLMCFDEPTSALDPSLTDDVANVIKSLSTQGMAMLIITHDMDFAKKVADRIVSMNNGIILEQHIYEVAEND
ncbi:polar amino acid ABC transporter ATP-binding protein [Sporanaerobium hydrogeniformans]|uniref:Polar amino acid ABC transporter ATP-binding protein n=1 Tax=Sporanaerobium hydrogeniformans TaxID=3072179 RepID=A0AC61DB56_9FIRM|nr:amino acid ABC transporter ATP-binding protein [Sporanaerobium hydrogeniformans]PHV70524.1 polar amino acid ABC transporter ATP-binding protein [Sporanaerobium hydrogeniformans]